MEVLEVFLIPIRVRIRGWGEGASEVFLGSSQHPPQLDLLHEVPLMGDAILTTH